MGNLTKSVTLACAIALVPLAQADAGGDFRFPPAPEPITQIPQPIPVPYYPTWYLRGDIAYGFHADPDLSQAGSEFGSSEMDDTWGFGAGFGYIFSDNIRGDLTLDYRLDTEANGTHPVTGLYHETSVRSIAALANLYYDFRGRDDFTPYIGAGLGFSYNETGDQEIYTGPALTSAVGGSNNLDFAFAAMAGVSYRFNDRWMLDAGYRYLHLGNAETDGNAIIDELSVKDIQAHEIRFGVRYEFQ